MNKNIRQFIGSTWKAKYVHKIIDIIISNTNNVKIYLIPTDINFNIENIESINTAYLELIFEKKLSNGYVETDYDMYGSHSDDNFKLSVNGKNIHSSKFMQIYLIVFDGLFTLDERDFVDH